VCVDIRCTTKQLCSVALCCRRWKPKIARQAPRKVAAHTAMSDIKESLKELQYYKSVLFKGAK
jgi:oligoribonuclease